MLAALPTRTGDVPTAGTSMVPVAPIDLGAEPFTATAYSFPARLTARGDMRSRSNGFTATSNGTAGHAEQEHQRLSTQATSKRRQHTRSSIGPLAASVSWVLKMLNAGGGAVC